MEYGILEKIQIGIQHMNVRRQENWWIQHHLRPIHLTVLNKCYWAISRTYLPWWWFNRLFDAHQLVASAPTASWMVNICSNKQKCHTSVLYPASYLWSALEYSVYCTIIRILQSFAACFLLTKYYFQFQVWLTAYFLSPNCISLSWKRRCL